MRMLHVRGFSAPLRVVARSSGQSLSTDRSQHRLRVEGARAPVELGQRSPQPLDVIPVVLPAAPVHLAHQGDALAVAQRAIFPRLRYPFGQFLQSAWVRQLVDTPHDPGAEIL